jgi:hypothetical protein
VKGVKLALILIGLMLLVSGCDVTYDIKIDKNLKVIETIEAIEDKEYNTRKYDNLLDRISIAYSSKYGEYVSIYEEEAIDDDTTIGNRYQKKYESISDFRDNSSVLKDILKDYSVTEYDSIVNIRAKVDDSLYTPGDFLFIIKPNNMMININLPFQVKSTNADSKKGNVYTWKIDENKRSTEVNISFDKNRLSNHIYIWNIGISYVILVVIAIALAVIITSYIVYRKFKNLNRI